MKKLTNEDKRILSKFLKEDWHDYIIADGHLSVCSCGMRGYVVRDLCSNYNRSFKTPDDMFAIKDKLVRKKMFDKFYIYSSKYWNRTVRDSKYYEWIINPKTFNKIAAEFIREIN